MRPHPGYAPDGVRCPHIHGPRRPPGRQAAGGGYVGNGGKRPAPACPSVQDDSREAAAVGQLDLSCTSDTALAVSP